MIRSEALRQEAGRDDLAPGPRVDPQDPWEGSGRPRGKSPHPGRRTALAREAIARLAGRPAGRPARRDLPRPRRAEAPPDAITRGTTILLDDDASPETLARNACTSGLGPPPTRPRPLLARLGPECPTRPVDWRWLKAGLMLDLGLRGSRRRDDGPTREARRYRAASRRCRDDAGRERLGARMPGIAGACAIRRRRAPAAVGRRGPPAGRRADRRRRPRGRPEARGRRLVRDGVLPRHRPARQPGLRRPRGRSASEPIGAPWRHEVDLLWKVFALFGGPEVLDALIRSTWDAAGEPRRPDEAPSKVVSLPGPMGLAIAAMTLPEDFGGRSGSKALLRLAASERRYAERATQRRCDAWERAADVRLAGVRAERGDPPWHHGDGGGGAGEVSQRQPGLMGAACVRDRRPGHRRRASARRGAERGRGWAPLVAVSGGAGGPSRAAGLGSGPAPGLQWVGGDAAAGAPGGT